MREGNRRRYDDHWRQRGGKEENDVGEYQEARCTHGDVGKRTSTASTRGGVGRSPRGGGMPPEKTMEEADRRRRRRRSRLAGVTRREDDDRDDRHRRHEGEDERRGAGMVGRDFDGDEQCRRHRYRHDRRRVPLAVDARHDDYSDEYSGCDDYSDCDDYHHRGDDGRDVSDMGMNNVDFRVNDRPPRHDNHHRHHYQQQHQQLHQQLLQKRTAAAAAFSAAYSAGGGGGASSVGDTKARTIPPNPVAPASDVIDNVDLAYWTSLSVKAAMAVTSAGGGDAIAGRAANAVLDFGNNGGRVSNVDGGLHDLAARVSLAILEAGGDHGVATAASVAIMNERGKRKNEEGAKNCAVGCHATPGQNGNGGENGDGGKLVSVSGTMEVNSTRPGKTNKMADMGNKEDGKAKANQNMEEDRKRKELGERQARSGATTPSRATLSSKVEEVNNFGLATQDKQQHHQRQQQQGQADAKEEALREKEEQIALKSKRLEEVFQLNLEKERQFRERMAALDAAAMAIIEPVKVVQRKIDYPTHVNVADQSGMSSDIEQVDWIHEVHDKGLLPMPTQSTELDANRSRDELGVIIANTPLPFMECGSSLVMGELFGIIKNALCDSSDCTTETDLMSESLSGTVSDSSSDHLLYQTTNQRYGERNSILRTNRVISQARTTGQDQAIAECQSQAKSARQGEIRAADQGKVGASKSLKNQSTLPVTSRLTKGKSHRPLPPADDEHCWARDVLSTSARALAVPVPAALVHGPVVREEEGATHVGGRDPNEPRRRRRLPGLFTRFGKKTAIKESTGRSLSTINNKNSSPPSKYGRDTKGKLVLFSNATRELFYD